MTRNSWALLGLITCMGCTPPASSDLTADPTARSRGAAIDFDGSQWMQYYGGRVLSNVRVYSVFWGSSGFNTDTRNRIGAAYADMVNSNWIDWLADYSTPSQFIGRGSWGGDIVIQPFLQYPTINDLNALSIEVDRQINLGVLPQPDDNTLFMIHFPLQLESAMCDSDDCAVNWSYLRNGTVKVRFATVADRGAGYNTTTVSASGALADSIVNPDIGLAVATQNYAYLGWRNDSGFDFSTLCYESPGWLGSSAQHSVATLVSQLWSNFAGRCIIEPLELNCTRMRVDGPNNGTCRVYNYSGQQVHLTTGALPIGLNASFSINPMPANGYSDLTLSGTNVRNATNTYVTVFEQTPTSYSEVGRGIQYLDVYSIWIDNPNNSVAIGGSTSYYLFNGTPYGRTLSVALPPNVTATWTNNPLPPQQVAILTVHANAGAPVGSTGIRVVDQFNYYSASGTLTVTCPSGQSYCDTTGQCVASGTCPPPPPQCPTGQAPCACSDSGACMTTAACRAACGPPDPCTKKPWLCP